MEYLGSGFEAIGGTHRRLCVRSKLVVELNPRVSRTCEDAGTEADRLLCLQIVAACCRLTYSAVRASSSVHTATCSERGCRHIETAKLCRSPGRSHDQIDGELHHSNFHYVRGLRISWSLLAVAAACSSCALPFMHVASYLLLAMRLASRDGITGTTLAIVDTATLTCTTSNCSSRQVVVTNSSHVPWCQHGSDGMWMWKAFTACTKAVVASVHTQRAQ
uniref:Polyketide synthase n=1 Tax=Peronospora matthiolae TaxID=2874970 RepID=A0AAV1TVK5_9STRA